MTIPQELFTAVCPLCATRLQPGLGHVCSTVGPEDDHPDSLVEYHRRKLAWALLGLVGRRTRYPRSIRR